MSLIDKVLYIYCYFLFTHCIYRNMKFYFGLVYLFIVCLFLQKVSSVRAENISIPGNTLYIQYLR